MFSFKIIKKDKNTRARLGILKTPHGIIHTPNIAIVATKGSIRGISFDLARKFGGEIFMINTFHFFHNDRYKIVEKFGGLHKFLNINYPLMTDSGGFQVFSLGFGLEHGVGKVADIFPLEARNHNKSLGVARPKGKSLVKIFEEGVEFVSPYDGKKLFLSPELSIKIQKILKADIIFAFDECTSPLSSYEYTKQAMKRTHRWALRCLEEFKGTKNQVIFGIVQGGEYEDLRKESAQFINSLPFFGFGIGGSLGKSKKDIIKVLNWTIPLLDENKPRHLLGIGEVDDIFHSIEQGIDLFDCIIPTRWARHGTGFTYKGRINLKSSKYITDKKPIDPECKCNVCQKYSRAYICHLLKEKEIYGIILLTEHNVFWILNLFKEIRKALKNNQFQQLKKRLLKYW
ncbi:MAG: tRNA guanosine(34) transglycosylase Tgt [Minisyncoccia bacterium]|jgi:queuine tRNA-ribosyltransferase/7-cyano-7-deazaguanine tRNA-ribosyltransferase